MNKVFLPGHPICDAGREADHLGEKYKKKQILLQKKHLGKKEKTNPIFKKNTLLLPGVQ